MKIGQIVRILRWQERWRLLLILQLLLVIAGVETLLLTLIPPLLRQLTNSAAMNSSESSQTVWGFLKESRTTVLVLFASVISVRFVLKLCSSLAESKFRQSVSIRLSEEYFSKVLNSTDSNDSSTCRINLNNLRQAADLLFDPLIRIYTESITAVVLIGYLFYSSPQLSLIFLILSVCLGVLVGPILLRASSRLGRETRNLEIEANRSIDETLLFKDETKIFGLKQYFGERFSPGNRQLVQKRSRLSQIYALVPALVEFGGSAIVITVIGVSSYLLGQGTEIVSTVAIFVVVAVRLVPSAGSLYSASIRVRYGISQLPDYERIVEKELTTPSPEVKSEASTVDTYVRLCLSDIGYKFPHDSQILFSSVNLTVEVGEIVGIFGPSGVGKSTLGLIAVGATDPAEGSVVMQSTSGEEVQTTSIPRGYVPQFVPILRGSLYENILLGRPLRSQSDLDELIAQVGLEHLNVRQFNEDSSFPEISGGERQRIGIARAIFGKPSLLVLDEVTSALDPQTEEEVMRLILKVSQFSSTVFITHRLGLQNTFSKSYVLSDGALKSL